MARECKASGCSSLTRMSRKKYINMNGRTPPLRLFYGELTYIYYTHIALLPLLSLQINLEDRVERRGRGEEGCARLSERERERGKVGRREREYWFLDSRTSASECRVSRSPARKNKSQGWSDGCGTPGSGGFAIWMADTVYQPHAQQIKFTFGRLPRASPGTDVPKTALHRNSLNGFDLSFPGLLCKDDVGSVFRMSKRCYSHNKITLYAAKWMLSKMTSPLISLRWVNTNPTWRYIVMHRQTSEK